MGKRKQKPVDTNDQGPIEPEAKSEALKRQESFTAFTESVSKGIEELAKNQKFIGEQLNATNQRVSNLAKTAPEQQQMNPIKIIELITNLMNSPPAKMIMDKIMGGEDEQPISQNQVPTELSDFYMDHFKQTMNLMREQQGEAIRSQRLKNDTMQKEIDSDL